MATSTARQVASLIEYDIRSRGLSEGDAYRTAEEVGRELSVHPRSVSRAMKLLALRGVLIRRRGVGTFIGPKVQSSAPVSIQPIEVLIFVGRRRVGLPSGDLVDGILEGSESTNVQLSLLPAVGQVAYVRELIQRSQTSGTRFGCVLIGCVREIQEFVLTSGVPAVVFGGVYPNTSALCSVDLDQAALGQLLAEYLLTQGRQRLALITHETWLPGDNAHHDGICRALEEAKSSQARMKIRSLPPLEPALVTEPIIQVLQEEDPPTGLICRGPVFATAAVAAAAAVGRRVPEDVEIVFDSWSAHSELDLPFAYAVSTYRDEAKKVGTMLRTLIEGHRPDPPHVAIPVRMTGRGANGPGRK